MIFNKASNKLFLTFSYFINDFFLNHKNIHQWFSPFLCFLVVQFNDLFQWYWMTTIVNFVPTTFASRLRTSEWDFTLLVQTELSDLFAFGAVDRFIRHHQTPVNDFSSLVSRAFDILFYLHNLIKYLIMSIFKTQQKKIPLIYIFKHNWNTYLLWVTICVIIDSLT